MYRNLEKVVPTWKEVIIAMSSASAGEDPAAALKLAKFFAESKRDYNL